MSDSQLTPKQADVLNQLPDKRPRIADELGITNRAVRYRMNKMENIGYKFERNSEGVWSLSESPENEEAHTPSDENETTSDGSQDRSEETKPKREKSYDRAQNTKDVHNTLTELEKEVKEALQKSNPVVDDTLRTSGSSTLVLPHSDSHVGAVIKDRYDVDYFSAERARRAIEEYFDRAIQAARERGNVEDAVIILNGDHLDGEGIYPGQRHEQEDNLRDQLRKAAQTYISQILKLADEFEHVSIFCVPGNHGRLDKRSTTNADMMLFDFVETAISHSENTNINFEKAGPGGFLNFSVRGWQYHARHGESYLEHVGTSSGKNRAKSKYMQYNFDVGIRSHYHRVKYESIGDNIPIVMTGSPAPPSTFAESKGASGGRCGVYWFTTDDRAIDDFQPISIQS